MQYAVNEEGAAALQAMSVAIVTSMERVQNLTATTQAVADGHSNTLGPHKASLDGALEAIAASLKEASEPIESISATLREVADAYQEIIGNDKIKSGISGVGASAAGAAGAAAAGSAVAGTAAAAKSQGKTGGSWFGGLFGRKERASGGGKFGSFDTGTYQNGTPVVKGDHYDQYMSDYYDTQFTSKSLDEPYVETIPPSAIEGIHLAPGELEDNGRFWGQHGGGTEETFISEITSHIPEVKRQIAAGKTLSEIRSDPKLAKCVDVYFDPSQIPHVTKSNGYYEFESNGRHRILAARKMGYDIPVFIDSVRVRK